MMHIMYIMYIMYIMLQKVQIPTASIPAKRPGVATKIPTNIDIINVIKLFHSVVTLDLLPPLAEKYKAFKS
jgi:hypothetical protein